MVKADNDQRQEEMDETGFDPDRSLNVQSMLSRFSLKVADLFSFEIV